MKKFLLSKLVALALAGGAIVSEAMAAGQVTVYPVEQIYTQTAAPYTLRAGGVEIPVVSYVDEYDYAQFAMTGGPVTIELTAPGQSAITTYSISPRKLELVGVVSGNKLTFTLESDQYLIVQINGLKRLVIAADPPEVDLPSVGPGVFDITAAPYAADRTGGALATKAVQAAIDAATAYGDVHGQGIVYLPAGLFRIGNLQLKSNVALYLEPGAVLRASGNPSDFTPHWYKQSQRRYITWFISTVPGSRNVKIYGRGTIDGNGKHLAETMNLGLNFLVSLASSDFAVDGVTFRDSGAWGIMTVRSDNLTFTNLKLFNRLNAGENDALDVCESQYVTVRNAIGISLDDPFSTKTWAAETDIALHWPGEPEPNRNIVFDRCISWTHCYAFKVGQGTCQLQDGVTFKNGVAYNCAVALGIDHKYGTAPVRNITFESIDVENVTGSNEGHGSWVAFFIQNALKNGGGSIGNVTVRNINVRDRGTSGGFLAGISDTAMIDSVVFDHVMMPGLARPATSLAELDINHTGYYRNLVIRPAAEASLKNQ